MKLTTEMAWWLCRHGILCSEGDEFVEVLAALPPADLSYILSSRLGAHKASYTIRMHPDVVARVALERKKASKFREASNLLTELMVYGSDSGFMEGALYYCRSMQTPDPQLAASYRELILLAVEPAWKDLMTLADNAFYKIRPTRDLVNYLEDTCLKQYLYEDNTDWYEDPILLPWASLEDLLLFYVPKGVVSDFMDEAGYPDTIEEWEKAEESEDRRKALRPLLRMFRNFGY